VWLMAGCQFSPARLQRGRDAFRDASCSLPPDMARSCRLRTHRDIVAVLNILDMADRFCTGGPMDYRGGDLVTVKFGADAFLAGRDSRNINTATVSRIKFCTMSTESAAFQAAAGGSPISHGATLAK
jgi:hypothetical protein